MANLSDYILGTEQCRTIIQHILTTLCKSIYRSPIRPELTHFIAVITHVKGWENVIALIVMIDILSINRIRDISEYASLDSVKFIQEISGTTSIPEFIEPLLVIVRDLLSTPMFDTNQPFGLEYPINTSRIVNGLFDDFTLMIQQYIAAINYGNWVNHQVIDMKKYYEAEIATLQNQNQKNSDDAKLKVIIEHYKNQNTKLEKDLSQLREECAILDAKVQTQNKELEEKELEIKMLFDSL